MDQSVVDIHLYYYAQIRNTLLLVNCVFSLFSGKIFFIYGDGSI